MVSGAIIIIIIKSFKAKSTSIKLIRVYEVFNDLQRIKVTVVAFLIGLRVMALQSI